MNLWEIAIEETAKKQADEENKRGESTIIFLGSKGAGKTTIISRFLNKNENPKPTIALEYTYARQNRNTALSKDVCHIWELGAGTLLSKLLEIPITYESLSSLNIILMIDLSKPQEMLYTLEHFLTTLHTTVDQLLVQDNELKEKLTQNVWNKLGNDHVDKNSIDPLLVPLVILGGKYDIFQDFDPEHKKIICRTLRFIAHKHGAALQFCSSKIENLVNKAKVLINNLAFGNPLVSHNYSIAQDYNKPLMIPFGADSFSQIDNSAASSQKTTSFTTWKNMFETHFPQISDKTVLPDDPAKDPNFKEPAVDTLRAHKDEELQRYQRMGE